MMLTLKDKLKTESIPKVSYAHFLTQSVLPYDYSIPPGVID